MSKIICNGCKKSAWNPSNMDPWDMVPYRTVRYFYNFCIDWVNSSETEIILYCQNCRKDLFEEDKLYSSDLYGEFDQCLMDAYRYVTHSRKKLVQQIVKFNSEEFLVYKNDDTYFAINSSSMTKFRISPILDKLDDLSIEVTDFLNKQLLPFI